MQMRARARRGFTVNQGVLGRGPNPYRQSFIRGTAQAIHYGKKALPYVAGPLLAYGATKLGYGKKATTKKTSEGYVTYKRKPAFRGQKGLKNQVKELSRIVKSEQAVHIHRKRSCYNQGISQNTSYFVSSSVMAGNSITNLEDAIANLKYYDPSTPGTLVTAAGATGTFSKEFYFKRSYHKMVVRNNYQVPVSVTLYCLRVKADTSIDPNTAFTNGLTDVGGISATSMLAYPTDSNQFNDLYKIEISNNKVLQPGQQAQIICTNKPFMYDPSLYDSHGLSFMRQFNCNIFAIRIEGALGHDNTVTTEQGMLPAAVDFSIESVYEIHYDAGASIKQITVDTSGCDNFTNGGVVSNKPVSDNQSYSVA